MKRLLAGVALLCVCAVLALLWGATSAYASNRCPIGHSTMGCSLPAPVKGVTAPPAGEIVPDVSSYQGAVDWAAVKRWQLSHGLLHPAKDCRCFDAGTHENVPNRGHVVVPQGGTVLYRVRDRRANPAIRLIPLHPHWPVKLVKVRHSLSSR